MIPAHETNKLPEVVWNQDVRLIFADVDQTLADDFMPAEPALIKELADLLREGRSLFLVTGGPLNRLRHRLIDQLPEELRQQVLVSHCSGAEVWGFDKVGEQRDEPFYSLYETLVSDDHKQEWRKLVAQIVDEFQLKTFEPKDIQLLREQAGNDPFSVILEDRGPQITLEVVNGYNLSEEQRSAVRSKLPDLEEVIDLREPIRARAEELFTEAGLPITPRFGGIFAVDLAIKGVSKADSVTKVLARSDILETIGVSSADIAQPHHLEIWGDRFNHILGTDWQMCVSLDPRVRAIDFRDEDPKGFPEGYNIVIWSGQHKLHKGALEYLQSRHKD